MPDIGPEESAKTRADRPRKWGNRKPVGKRLDLSPGEAERREKKKRDQQGTEFLSVRMTAPEKETVTRRAKAYGMKLSEFARTILLSGLKEPPPPKVDPEAVRALAFQISKVGTNFNQITARINEAKQIATDKQLQVLLAMEKQTLALSDDIAKALAHVIEL